jgi:hypothetical protein
LQSPQRIFERRAQCFRAAVNHAIAIDALHAAFAREQDFILPGLQRRTDEFFIASEAVKRGGVEMIIAKLNRLMQQFCAFFRRRRRAIGVIQIHAAKPDRIDFSSGEAPFTHCHWYVRFLYTHI